MSFERIRVASELHQSYRTFGTTGRVWHSEIKLWFSYFWKYICQRAWQSKNVSERGSTPKVDSSSGTVRLWALNLNKLQRSPKWPPFTKAFVWLFRSLQCQSIYWFRKLVYFVLKIMDASAVKKLTDLQFQKTTCMGTTHFEIHRCTRAAHKALEYQSILFLEPTFLLGTSGE